MNDFASRLTINQSTYIDPVKGKKLHGKCFNKMLKIFFMKSPYGSNLKVFFNPELNKSKTVATIIESIEKHDLEDRKILFR